MKVEFTRLAEQDLEDIGDRIALRNPPRAVTYVEEIRRKALNLADFPNSGTLRPAWGEGVRMDVHGRYLIIYRVRTDAVQVLRVVHGARDLDALLMGKPPRG